MLEADSSQLRTLRTCACFAAKLNSLYKQQNQQNIHKRPQINLIITEWRAWLQALAALYNSMFQKAALLAV